MAQLLLVILFSRGRWNFSLGFHVEDYPVKTSLLKVKLFLWVFTWKTIWLKRLF